MSSGWQDAVAGLQSQVNTINSQISSLSGQEAADASAINSLQTQVSALQTEVTNLPLLILADIPASSMATLGSFASDGTQKTVQLSAGGNAVLQVPVQDGISFRVKITGHTHNPVNFVNLHVRFYVNGQDTGHEASQAGNVLSPNQPFHFEERIFWDSTSNKIVTDGTTIAIGTSGAVAAGNTLYSASLSSPSNLPFSIAAYVDSPDPTATLTITEFRAYSD